MAHKINYAQEKLKSTETQQKYSKGLEKYVKKL